MEGGDDQAERDPLDGAERIEGEAAAREAEGGARRARYVRDGRPYPLDGLAERIKAEGKPELAFADEVLDELLDMRGDEALAFQAERRKLGAVGVRVGHLDKALDALAKRRREAADAEEKRARAALDAARAGARDREEAEAAAALKAARDAAPPDLRGHYADPVTINGCVYNMTPGRMWLERWRRDELVPEDLAEGSIAIPSHVYEVTSPAAAPRASYEVTAKVFGEEGLRPPALVAAADFRSMAWVEDAFPGLVVLEKGRREDLRIAIEKLSPAAKRAHRYVYRCSGWLPHEGALAYVHGGGGIGPRGPVEGVRAEPRGATDRVGLFTFPPTAGSDRAADLRALARMLEIEPAHVAVPCLGGAVRPVMGGAPNALHVWGGSQAGKSRFTSMYWRLFGAAMHYKNAPASWADSAASILSGIGRVGNALVGIDDMQPYTDPTEIEKVFRAVFNGAAPGRLRRDGTDRDVAALRGSVLSNGERGIRGPSLPSRVCVLHLAERSPTNFDESGLEALAASGQLARAMAHLVEDYAPRYAANLGRLEALERDNAARWELGLADRDAEVFRPLALGVEALLRLLRAAEVITADELEAHRRRAAEAMRTAAQGNRAAVQQQHPGVVALEALGAAIRSCSNDGAHVGASRIVGKRRVPRPPPHCERWGYARRGDMEPQAMGARVGVRHWEDPSRVVLDLGVALTVAKKWAPRVTGGDLPAGTTRELREHIRAAGLVVHQEEGRPDGSARVVTGEAGSKGRLEGVAVAPSSLGIDTTDDPPEDDGEEQQQGRQDPPEPGDF